MYELRIYGTAGPGDYIKLKASNLDYAAFKQEFHEHRYPVLEIVNEEDGDILTFATRHISLIVAEKLTKKAAHETS